MLVLLDEAWYYISMVMIHHSLTPYLDIRHATREACDGWSRLSLPVGHILARTIDHQNFITNIIHSLKIGHLGFVNQGTTAPLMATHLVIYPNSSTREE